MKNYKNDINRPLIEMTMNKNEWQQINIFQGDFGLFLVENTFFL